MYLYTLTRKDKNGLRETIQAWSPCKGWKVIGKIKVSFAQSGII